VPTATPPGTYLFHAQIGSDASPARSFVTLDVVNAATKGQIAGSIMSVDAGSSFMMQETIGNLELYDSSTGAGIGTNFIQNFSSISYLASYLQPGSYRVRWVPMFAATAPQWYPQAATFAQAAPIQVQAGQTVSNINFYLRPVPVAPSSLVLPAPVFNGTESAFSTPTVAGVFYWLEYKDSLTDAQWKPIQVITGTGDTMVLADSAAASSHRFYRLRMQAP
jgi:hypothetical protein